MFWRIIWQLVPVGISTVSLPVQGAPPTNTFSSLLVQQRWQMLPPFTLLVSVLVAWPVTIRNPYEDQIRGLGTWFEHKLSLMTFHTFLKAVVLPLGM